MIGDIMQPTHLLFVLVIALLVLGPKRLPEVGRQLGKGLRDFRAAINGEHVEHEEDTRLDQSHLSEADQTPPQEFDQFAHEPTESVTSQDESEATAEDHQFGHEAPVDVAGPEANSTAGDEKAGTGPAGHEAETGGPSGSADEHEFAYQPARPADKPADPLA